MRARAAALGIAQPEPHVPGAPPPAATKPSRLTMNQQPYLVMGRALGPARAEYVARNAARLASECAALWGAAASDLAAFDRPAAD